MYIIQDLFSHFHKVSAMPNTVIRRQFKKEKRDPWLLVVMAWWNLHVQRQPIFTYQMLRNGKKGELLPSCSAYKLRGGIWLVTVGNGA